MNKTLKKFIRIMALSVFLIIVSIFLINMNGKGFKDRNLSLYKENYYERLNKNTFNKESFEFLPSLGSNTTSDFLVPGKEEGPSYQQLGWWSDLLESIWDGFSNIWKEVQEDFKDWFTKKALELFEGLVTGFFDGEFNVREVPVIGDEHSYSKQKELIEKEIKIRERELKKIPELQRELRKELDELRADIGKIKDRKEREEAYKLLDEEMWKYDKQIRDLTNQLNHQLNQLYKQLEYVNKQIEKENEYPGNRPPYYEPPEDKPGLLEPDYELVNSYKYINGSVNDYTTRELGLDLKCGDEVYVTLCEKGNRRDKQCEIDVINNQRIRRSYIPNSIISNNKPSARECGESKSYAGLAGARYYEKGSDIPRTIPCGDEVKLVGSINQVCQHDERTITNGKYSSDRQFCEASLRGRTIYVQWGDLTDRPPSESACSKNECVPERPLKNQKNDKPIRKTVCYQYDRGDVVPLAEDEYSIFTCASGYKREMKEIIANNTCKTDQRYPNNTCVKEFEYKCVFSERPIVSGHGSYVGPNHYGTLKIFGIDNKRQKGLEGYQIYRGIHPTTNSYWKRFDNNSYEAEMDATVGIYFATVMTVDKIMSYPITLSIQDQDISTTANINISDADGSINYPFKSIEPDITLGNAYDVKSSDYALLSNKSKLLNHSVFANGFDIVKNGYELDVDADKITIFATLTDEDSSYVDGYGPRTISLNYGRNVALVRIVNKEGKERAYTFVINKTDARNNYNVITNISTSVGELVFDPYISDYTVKVPKDTKKVDVNATLVNFTTAFVKNYEPREVVLKDDITTTEIKTISDAGIVRSYVLTFIKEGTDTEKDLKNSVNLSSLTVTDANLRFNKNTTSYSIAVGYEVTSLEVSAFPESENATVKMPKHIPLQPGPNNLEIIVTNGLRKKVYNIFINRKEENLGISNNTNLKTLTVKDYNLNFKPDVYDYKIRIKQEKTLLFTATAEDERSEVYMYGNNDLTAYSTVRIKVIAEDGSDSLYSVDIVKDLFDKDFEKTAAIIGGIIIVVGAILIVVIRKRKNKKSYIEN